MALANLTQLSLSSSLIRRFSLALENDRLTPNDVRPWPNAECELIVLGARRGHLSEFVDQYFGHCTVILYCIRVL